MSALARKLQLKDASIRVLGRPEGVADELAPRIDDGGKAEALLVFVRDRAALEPVMDAVVENGAADRLTWVAYPKEGRLGTDLNRDRLWKVLHDRGLRAVRNVSVDDVWSALRFRPRPPQ